MLVDDYGKGDAFQAEKRTVFTNAWLPLCAEAQLEGPGTFLSATVGGWSVVAVRDAEGAVRVLRNACRHQNMPVVGTPSGRCESFRCRFHGWTYDLQGRFLSAPPPVAPAAQSADHDLVSLPATSGGSVVFFSVASPRETPQLGALPDYVGTLNTEIACNWKVCVEHLLAEQPDQSPDFAWHWPLLAVRRAGQTVVVKQILPVTFLRTRLVTHTFGGAIEDRQPAAAMIKRACERLQSDRMAGMPPAGGGMLLAEFHRRLAEARATG